MADPGQQPITLEALAAQLNAMGANMNQLIQALANQQQAQQQPAPVVAPQPQPNQSASQYDGGAFNLDNRTQQSLMQEGMKPLSLEKPYNGSVETLFGFVSALKGCAFKCRWDATNGHGILRINNKYLLDDYGQFTQQELVAVRDARVDERANQNATMMYHCILESLADAYGQTLNTDPDLSLVIREDGPLLFFKLVSANQATSFIEVRSLRDKLNALHPKQFSYDITRVNQFLRQSITILMASVAPSRDEQLYWVFGSYKRIKSPLEWVTKISVYEERAITNNQLPLETVYTQAESLYTNLKKGPQGWHASDRSIQDQIVAMISTNKQGGKNKKPGGKDDDKKPPAKKPLKDGGDKKPFKLPTGNGKEGDQKKVNGRQFYWCDFPHKNGHWVTHPPSKCDLKTKNPDWKKDGFTPPKSNKPDGNRLTVDRNAVRSNVATFLAAAGIDADSDAAFDAIIGATQQE